MRGSIATLNAVNVFTIWGIAFSGFPAPNAFGVETSGDVIGVIIVEDG